MGMHIDRGAAGTPQKVGPSMAGTQRQVPMHGKHQAGVHKHNMHHAHKHAAHHMTKRLGNIAKGLKSRRASKSGKSAKGAKASGTSTGAGISALTRELSRDGGSGSGSGGGQQRGKGGPHAQLANTNTKLTPDKMASFVDELATLLTPKEKKGAGGKDEEDEPLTPQKFREVLRESLKNSGEEGEKFGHKDYNDACEFLADILRNSDGLQNDGLLEIIEEAQNQNDSEFIEKLGQTSETILDRVSLGKEAHDISTGLLDHTSKNLEQSEQIWGNTLQIFFGQIDDLIEHNDELSPAEIIGEIKNLYMQLIADTGQRVNPLVTIEEGNEGEAELGEASVTAQSPELMEEKMMTHLGSAANDAEVVSKDYARQEERREKIDRGENPPPDPKIYEEA